PVSALPVAGRAHLCGVLLALVQYLLLVLRPPARCTPFPYTTLFRSVRGDGARAVRAGSRRPLHHPRAADRRQFRDGDRQHETVGDRKSTRLNSSHVKISYAVFCLQIKVMALELRTLPRGTAMTAWWT